MKKKSQIGKQIKRTCFIFLGQFPFIFVPIIAQLPVNCTKLKCKEYRLKKKKCYAPTSQGSFLSNLCPQSHNYRLKWIRPLVEINLGEREFLNSTSNQRRFKNHQKTVVAKKLNGITLILVLNFLPNCSLDYHFPLLLCCPNSDPFLWGKFDVV